MNTKRLLFDTNIIIDFLRGKEQAQSFFKSINNKSNLLVSAITVTKLYAGVKSTKEEKLLRTFLPDYQTIAVS